MFLVFVAIIPSFPVLKYVRGSSIFTFSSLPDTSFCMYFTFPLSVVSDADVSISPIPCVYSYVLLLYVLPVLDISLGDTYTNSSLSPTLYFAKFAYLYVKYPVFVWLFFNVDNTASLLTIGILFNVNWFSFISFSVIVPEYSRFSSSIFKLYAFFVFSIFSARYFFSLSNSFVLTNIKSNPTITTKSATKYIGITAKFFNIFAVFLCLKYFKALYAKIIITNAKITYPHSFIVDSVIPAPVISISPSTVKIFPNIKFCEFKTVIIATAIIINKAFFVSFFMNKLSFSILGSTPSKYLLNTII